MKLDIGQKISRGIIFALLWWALMGENYHIPMVYAESDSSVNDPNKVTDYHKPPDHSHIAFDQEREQRLEMVESQIHQRGVFDPNVLQVMRTVPRHAFVRKSDSSLAYKDQPLPIGFGQTISQPYIVGYMTEELHLEPHHKVLEVGAGSGYQAAVCAELAQAVYTIEIIKELADSAAKRLETLGYHNIEVKQGDGYFGWPERGPYDAIIITAVAGMVPSPLIQQLKPGGRMILPLGSPYGMQTLTVISKTQEGEIRSKSLVPVRFVPMIGEVMKQRRDK